MVDVFKGNIALEAEKVLLVVLNGGDDGAGPEIELAVAAAAQAGKAVRAMVGYSTRVPAFFKQVDDLIVRYFEPEEFASCPAS